MRRRIQSSEKDAARNELEKEDLRKWFHDAEDNSYKLSSYNKRLKTAHAVAG